MTFEKSEIIIEVILMIVLIMGVIRCQQIVKGLKTAKDSCKTIDDLGANLDSSVEQATAVFDNIRHQITTAERKVSVLVDHAINIEEDLEDREKAAKEADVALSLVMQRMKNQEEELSSMLEKADSVIEQLRSQLEHGADIVKDLETRQADLISFEEKQATGRVEDRVENPARLESGTSFTEEPRDIPQALPDENATLGASEETVAAKPLRPYLRRQNKAP